MIIKSMRCYFLYNVPVTEKLLVSHETHTIGVTPQVIDKMRAQFTVDVMEAPAFYTNHYRTDHAAYKISDDHIPEETTIPLDKLQALDFFAELPLTEDVRVTWDFSLALQNAGLVTICLHVKGKLPSNLAYRLGGLHLNPDYQVIDTTPIQHLWSQHPDDVPDYVHVDELARVIHQYFFTVGGLKVRRYRALRHEIQIPFIAVDVETDQATQRDFVEQETRNLAELVFKPACWEVETASMTHAQHILEPQRVWSVAKDTLVVVAYEGALYVKIKNFDTGVPHQVSNFHLVDEEAVLYSFKVAISNYHLLRILDDLLDKEVEHLRGHVGRYQMSLNRLFEPNAGDDAGILREMNEFAIQVTTLQFQLIDLMEEINNPDKLIDEEWHIVLLDKLNEAFGTKIWFDSVNNRVKNLNQIVKTVENTYERLSNLNFNKNIADVNQQLLQMSLEDKNLEDRLRRVQPVFEALAAAELVGLLIAVLFDDSNALVAKTAHRFGISLVVSHWVITFFVFLFLYGLIRAIRWFANRSPIVADE